MRAIWKSQSTLGAMMAVLGSVRYTVDQYEYTRNHLRDLVINNADIWPPYSRIKLYFDKIRDTCIPESKVVYMSKKKKNRSSESNSQSGAAPHTNPDRCDYEPVRFFFPMSWAKLDVATATVFNQMYPASMSEQEMEHSQLVRYREQITEPCRYILVDNNGQNAQCGPGSTIRVSVQSSKPHHRTSMQMWESRQQHHFDATIAEFWCVGKAPMQTLSGFDAIHSGFITTSEKGIIKSLSGADTSLEPSNARVIPGDLCALLRADKDFDKDDFIPILIYRFWRQHTGTPSIMLLWARQTQNSDEHVLEDLDMKYSDHYVVELVSLRRSVIRGEQGLNRRPRGTLSDGTPYLVYRILLYSDDFQRSSSPSNDASVGGCYFMPLSFRPEQRRTTSSARLISLAPRGVSTNDVLRFVVDDLVHGTVCGVVGVTPSGTRVKIFLYVVGFIGDYPASSEVIDVIGDVGRSPCTMCSFRRLHHFEAEGSRFGYTTDVHANNSTFLRSAERHEALRLSDINKKSATTFSMARSSVRDTQTWPLHLLYKKLRRCRGNTMLTEDGLPVDLGSIDPYRCNFIALDHLLTGLSKDILNTVFQCLPTNDMRLLADIYICAALRDKGLLGQREVYNCRKNAMNSMTLSELYCFMVVAVPCFKLVTAQCSQSDVTVRTSIKILAQLQHLIALKYWWPESNIDGCEAAQFVHKSQLEYFAELKRLSKGYVRSVDEFCVMSEIGKKNLDKLNLHRLLELYEYSIPAFSHVREFMELIFESVHQHLKRAIEGGNNHEIQLFTVEQGVANDWQGRLASLRREALCGDAVRHVHGKRGIRRVLLGPEADLLDEERDKDFIKETDEILGSLFTPAVQRYLRKYSLV